MIMLRSRLAARWQEIVIGILAALGVTVYVIVSIAAHDVGFPLDDSWIHQTYARNLAERGEWAFVPGEPSVASTSPLFTVLLAVGYSLHIRFFVWVFALGALALAGAGWIGVRLGKMMFPELPHSGLWTGLALVLTWHLVWAAASGMETMLFCTLSLVMVWLAWRELSTNQHPARLPNTFGRGMFLGLAGAALTLTRPEGVGLVALTGLMMLLAWPYGGARTGWRLYLAWGSGMAVGWLIGVTPYLALNYDVGETWLPSTSAAKQAENAPALELPLLERYGKMLLPLVAGGQLLLVPGVAVALYVFFRRVDRDRQAVLFLLPMAWALVDLSAYALRLPAPYQHGRYVIPILPHVLLYGVGGTLRIVWAGRSSPLTRVLSRSLGLSVVLIMPGFWIIGAQQYGRDVRIINTEMVDTARWVKQELPPDELLAVHDIGALGYYAPRPILDLAGLVSPEVVPIIRDHEAVMQLMCERGVRYLMVLPDQLPTTTDDPRLGPRPVFVTNAPYSPAAGGGNMAVYELHWPEQCD
jgi:hypothetical protein